MKPRTAPLNPRKTCKYCKGKRLATGHYAHTHPGCPGVMIDHLLYGDAYFKAPPAAPT